MYQVSDNYKQSIQALSRRFKAKFVIGTHEFTERDIMYIELDEGLGTGDKFLPGGGFINELDVEIGRIIEGLTEDTEAKAYVSLLVGEELFEEVPLGVFYAKEIVLNRNSKRTKIKLQDGMYRLNVPYDSKLSYPSSTRAMVEEIANTMGVVLSPHLNVADYPVMAKLEKVTMREVLVFIAQLNGSFVRFDRLGRLEFVQLTNSNRRVPKSNYYLNGLEKNEVLYRVNGMTNEIAGEGQKKVIYKEGADTGNIVAFKNPLMNQAILSRVYDLYRDFNFYPFSLKWQGDMAILSGEWLSVESYDGTFISLPILSQKLRFNGGLSSTASGKSATVSQGQKEYRGTLTQQVDYLNTLITSQGNVYSDPTEPVEPKNGDTWFKPNGGYVELYERQNGAWVKKADTADMERIISKITTDEVIAKKISAAVAQIIELNANKIVAGSIDLNRVRVVQGTKEILGVRDGKVFIDVSNVEDFKKPIKEVEAKLEMKADKLITEDQLKHLQDQQLVMMQEMKAKATLETVLEWKAKYEAFVKTNESERKQAQDDLVSLSQRMIGIQNDLGSMTAIWNAIDRNMKFGNEGLSIGNPQGDSSILVSDNRISMMSGGREVMSISQGVIHIDNGVFTKSIQIGYYVESQYNVNPKYNVIRYVGP
ncbi:hypothetical protein [Granulicatella adiacens]|uniref:hypothetical protein n=1 Tax=Granulicatella adiacens TaxID=46124 RepID=UPI00402827B6